MKLSLQTSQMLVYVVVVALMGTLTIYAGFSFISETVVNEAKTQVQMNLNSAWSAYEEQQTTLQMTMCECAQREELRSILTGEGDSATVRAQLGALRERNGLDYLAMVDRSGRMLIQSPLSSAMHERARSDPVIKSAMSGAAAVGTLLLSPEDLKRENPELARTSFIPLVETEHARPTDRKVETRSLVLEAALPITGKANEVLGTVYGGVVLNRRYQLVDDIRNAVFGNEVYEGKPLGTVTIFLWDVRVTTNVIRKDSTRAIGTRVSDVVYARVLESGERFGDRAFVVNDWYLSAYDPIRDPDDNIVGILYVGLLEKKYLDYRSSLALKFFGISLASLILAMIIGFFLIRTLRRPIHTLVAATRGLSAGNLDVRVTETGSIREMTELADAFNSMAEALETHNRQLNAATEELRKAYQEADAKNRAYLEMLGFVTHELKSPLASIVFSVESIRDQILGPINDQQEMSLKAASSSADYLQATITNYLNLSRIEEGQFNLKVTRFRVKETIIDPVIQRLADWVSDNDMTVTCEVGDDVEMSADVSLMTSVFQNLISNAIKYGSAGGLIAISSGIEPDSGDLAISVYNQGIGFSEEEKRGLFTKFSRFGREDRDTKPGTGIGLFVTREIVERHGGRIRAESEPGQWARFVFTIPANEKVN